MLSRPSDGGHTPFGDIFYSESPDLCHWGVHRHVMSSGSLWWEGVKIGSGAVPIETDKGWLLLYHGVRSFLQWLRLQHGCSLARSREALDRSRTYYGPILMPELDYETTGSVPNVVFPCATLHDEKDGRIAIYYGAADTHVALAFAWRDELVARSLSIR